MKSFTKITVALFSLAVITILTLALTQDASASHFRYGHLTYTRTGADCNTLVFTLYNAFRRGGYAPNNNVGDAFTETIGATQLIFGDGSANTPTLRYRVLSIDIAEDWLFAVALQPGDDNVQTITHTYTAAGPSFLAEINSAARTGVEINHPNQGYRVSALLWNNDCQQSAVSNLPVIVNLAISPSVTFNVPAIGSGPNKHLFWRYATIAEMGVTGSNPFPAFGGAGSINSANGDITWNTSSALPGQLYSTQVIIEERDDATDTIKSRVAVDWLSRMLPPCSRPGVPTIEIKNATLNGVPINVTCGSVIVGNLGDCLDFTVNARDSDLGDPVTLNAPAPPTGTYTPPLPLTGRDSVSTTLHWCCPSPFTGIITFTATDSCGNQTLCPITLDWRTILPVELASFVSTISGNSVTLNWTTASEENNARFEIERANVINGNTSEWNTIGTVQGNGTTTTQKSYSFTDRGLNAGTFSYRLKQVDFNGNYTYHNLSGEVVIGVPTRFDLLQNYPNPFNPTTNIAYILPKDGNVMLSVYDNSGKLVSSMNEGFKAAGYYTVTFSASDLSSGVYYYRINFSGSDQSFEKVMKMVVVK